MTAKERLMAIKLRTDHDVLTAYRRIGSRWQRASTPIRRKAARKL